MGNGPPFRTVSISAHSVLHGAQFDVTDLQAECVLGDTQETGALIRECDCELARAFSGSRELLLAE